MPIEAVHIVGTGGHALVVLDALQRCGTDLAAVTLHDQNPERIGRVVADLLVAELDPAALSGRPVHVAIGDNATRARVTHLVLAAGGRMQAIIDPLAIISPRAIIGSGSFVAAGAIVAAGVNAGAGVIINHGAIVDHECVLGEFVHVAPGATLAGAVRVGRLALVGAGANILPRLSVGSGTTLGAGAVLIQDASGDATYVGVPAKRIR